jgi:enoyl-CoA hydratase/carnithine racemase
MSSDHIAYEKRGSIGFVKFNRPDKRNAFTVEMFQRTAEVFTEADDDVDIRCIVVHAEGPDTTTGLDLMNVVPSFRAGEVPIGEDEVDPWHVIGRLRRKPMITAAQGRCYTLGTEIALCSDICVAASDTRFGLKEVRVVQEIVEPGKQLERAQEMAEVIAAQAPLAVQAALAHAQSALLDGWRTAIAEIVPVQRELINSEDAMEAAMAMMQKRPATFKGR